VESRGALLVVDRYYPFATRNSLHKIQVEDAIVAMV
jgi:hypothetical protein